MNSEIDPRIVESLAKDAGAFMQRMDLVQGRALFVRVAENELRSASFLDERLGLQGREGFWLPLSGVGAVAASIPEPVATPDFIFHIGHCGSTLLSRLLDQDITVLGLREPLVLREIAAAERELDAPTARISPSDWQALFAGTLAILGRRFAPAQRVIAKATSTCNNLVEPLLGHDAQVRVVLLHLPLESYLATMMKAPGGGLDALQGAPARLAYLHRVLGDESIRLYQLDPAQAVAMGWVAELARFTRIASDPILSPRVLMLDFERLLTAPAERLAAVRAHLGLPAEAPDDATLARSPVMRAYAKSPSHAYSPEDRAHDLELSRRKFAAEIARGMAWAETLLEDHDVLGPLRPLLRLAA